VTEAGGSADEAAVEQVITLARSLQLRLPAAGEEAHARASALLALLEPILVDTAAPRHDPAGHGPGPGPDPQQLTSMAAELPAIVRNWCAATGRSESAFRASRTRFLRGHDVAVEFPVRTLVRALHQRLRDVGAIDRDRKVSLVWTDGRPSMTLPIRIPGWTAVALPAQPVVLASQYVHHEFGHVIEVASRPAHWSLLDRWQVSNLAAETAAMVVEALGRDERWLRELGIEPRAATQAAGYCTHEDRYNRALAALIILCDQTPVHRRARLVTELTDGLIEAGHPQEEAGRATYWRTLLAAYSAADELRQSLIRRYGDRWADQERAWQRLRGLLRGTGARPRTGQTGRPDHAGETEQAGQAGQAGQTAGPLVPC